MWSRYGTLLVYSSCTGRSAPTKFSPVKGKEAKGEKTPKFLHVMQYKHYTKMCNELGWRFIRQFKDEVTGQWNRAQDSQRDDMVHALSFQMAYAFFKQGVTDIDTDEIELSLKNAVEKKTYNKRIGEGHKTTKRGSKRGVTKKPKVQRVKGLKGAPKTTLTSSSVQKDVETEGGEGGESSNEIVPRVNSSNHDEEEEGENEEDT